MKNDVIPTITYLLSVAVVHCIVGEPYLLYHKCLINHATTCAKLLYGMVAKANNGCPVYHILPGLITSIDDTAIFVFRGTTTSVQGWYLLDNESTGKK